MKRMSAQMRYREERLLRLVVPVQTNKNILAALKIVVITNSFKQGKISAETAAHLLTKAKIK